MYNFVYGWNYLRAFTICRQNNWINYQAQSRQAVFLGFISTRRGRRPYVCSDAKGEEKRNFAQIKSNKRIAELLGLTNLNAYKINIHLSLCSWNSSIQRSPPTADQVQSHSKSRNSNFLPRKPSPTLIKGISWRILVYCYWFRDGSQSIPLNQPER